MDSTGTSAMNSTCSRFFDGDTICLPYDGIAPFYYIDRPSVITGLSDPHLAILAPLIAYWSLSLFFHCLDMSDWRWLDKYRIHESDEVQSKNRVSRFEVVCAVLVQHAIQTMLGLLMLSDEAPCSWADHMVKMEAVARIIAQITNEIFGEKFGGLLLDSWGHRLLYLSYWWAIPTAQFLFAMCVTYFPVTLQSFFDPIVFRFFIDAWQYFFHRLMHTNKFLYKHLHSVHHRLYVPYAFGALYNHPIEGLVLDSLGALLAEMASFMTTRQAALLFAFSTLKTVDDHCGYNLPFDPLQLFSANKADYHDIHHQVCRRGTFHTHHVTY
jgi:sphinganine C4-monooxygenase